METVIEFTIPPWTRRIEVEYHSQSTNEGIVQVRLGGEIETSDYVPQQPVEAPNDL